MKTVAISPRRDHYPERPEVRDAIDVRWAKILFDLGLMPIVLSSELMSNVDYINKLNPDIIFLSSGTDIGADPSRDTGEFALLDYAVQNNVPVFGLCRGMQMMNHYFGGALVPVSGHVRKRQAIFGDWASAFGINDVNSFHNFGIFSEALASEFQILARSQDGVIKAMRHQSLPWLGIMWHPEREPEIRESDRKMLTYFFENVMEEI